MDGMIEKLGILNIKEWDNFLDQMIKQAENVLKKYDKLGHMSFVEEEEFMKEKERVVQLLSDNLKHFGW